MRRNLRSVAPLCHPRAIRSFSHGAHPARRALESSPQRRMSLWDRLVGGKSSGQGSRRVDYLKEAMALERQGDFEGALTSYRLAQREHPTDASILVNIAIAYSKTGRLEDA